MQHAIGIFRKMPKFCLPFLIIRCILWGMEIQKYMSLMAIAMKVLGVTQGALTAVARASKDFPEQRPDGHYETVAVLEYLANRRTKGNKLRDKARLGLSDMRKSGRADDLGTNMDMAVRMARRMALGLSGSAVPTEEEAAKAAEEAKAEAEAEVEAETKTEANAAAKAEPASMSSFPSLPKLGGVGSGNGDGDCDFDSILSQYRVFSHILTSAL